MRDRKSQYQHKQKDIQIKPFLTGDGEALTLVNNSSPRTMLATTSGVRWYAAYTAPSREKRVFESLSMRQVESFLPLYRSPRKWKNGCRVELERPLFPGYVFVRISVTERIRVLEVPSVVSIVSRGRVPEPLQDDAIEILRTNLHLRRAEPHSYLVVGEKVSICAGPFAGLSGIVLRKKGSLRVVINLDLLTQSIAVEVDTDDLEAVPSSLAKPGL